MNEINEIKERYDVETAVAWILGHARKTGNPALPDSVSRKTADACSEEEQIEILSAGLAAGLKLMLSGLPGTGKDTWIQSQHPDMPVVSLDEIRAELGIKPVGPQGEVIQAAQMRAREYLRRKQPFIWNATNLTKDIRQGLIRLFESYGARVRIVYLETGLQTRLARNLQRAAAVPEDAVSRMLEKTAPPTPDEAQTVEWLCV